MPPSDGLLGRSQSTAGRFCSVGEGDSGEARVATPVALLAVVVVVVVALTFLAAAADAAAAATAPTPCCGWSSESFAVRSDVTSDADIPS
jgi:hypothetical protein